MFEIFNREETKVYSLVYTKRRKIGHDTVPYGY